MTNQCRSISIWCTCNRKNAWAVCVFLYFMAGVAIVGGGERALRAPARSLQPLPLIRKYIWTGTSSCGGPKLCLFPGVEVVGVGVWQLAMQVRFLLITNICVIVTLLAFTNYQQVCLFIYSAKWKLCTIKDLFFLKKKKKNKQTFSTFPLPVFILCGWPAHGCVLGALWEELLSRFLRGRCWWKFKSSRSSTQTLNAPFPHDTQCDVWKDALTAS